MDPISPPVATGWFPDETVQQADETHIQKDEIDKVHNELEHRLMVKLKAVENQCARYDACIVDMRNDLEHRKKIFKESTEQVAFCFRKIQEQDQLLGY